MKGRDTMGSLSYRAGKEGKHNKKNLAKASAHTYRKTEQKYKKHGNEKIDMSMTKYNRDWTITGAPLGEIVEDKIANEYAGKKAIRKDAVVVREIIVQASPEIYQGLSIEEQQELSANFTNDTYEFLCDEFGEDNVLGYSEHLDETNPHTHFSIMPMTQDGRLSQKDFFKGPGDFKRQHRQYREHMNSLGWEFDTENKYEEQEAVPLAKYKANAKAIEAKRAENQQLLDELREDPNIHSQATQEVLQSLEMQLLNEREEELREREEALEQLIDKAEDKYGSYADGLKLRAKELDETEERLQYMTGFAEAVMENKPKVATQRDVDKLLYKATDGRFRVLQPKGSDDAVLAERNGERWRKTSVSHIVGTVYDMKGQDVAIDPAYEQTQSLSYALGKYKYIDEPVPDSVATSEGFSMVAEGAYEKQKELERDKTL